MLVWFSTMFPPAMLVLELLMVVLTCDIFGIARSARVQTVAPGSEMPDLQKSADDHDVLEKMDHLVLVREVFVKEDRGRQSEHRKTDRHPPRAKPSNNPPPISKATAIAQPSGANGKPTLPI